MYKTYTYMRSVNALYKTPFKQVVLILKFYKRQNNFRCFHFNGLMVLMASNALAIKTTRQNAVHALPWKYPGEKTFCRRIKNDIFSFFPIFFKAHLVTGNSRILWQTFWRDSCLIKNTNKKLPAILSGDKRP